MVAFIFSIYLKPVLYSVSDRQVGLILSRPISEYRMTRFLLCEICNQSRHSSIGETSHSLQDLRDHNETLQFHPFPGCHLK